MNAQFSVIRHRLNGIDYQNDKNLPHFCRETPDADIRGKPRIFMDEQL
jgi:hypothetical protein